MIRLARFLAPHATRFLAVVLLFACGQPTVETVAPELNDYTLGPGDRLKVTVFGHPDESGEFDIDGSGQLAYPLLGRVHAQGRTLVEFQEQIRAELNNRFIINPSVTVEVLQYRPFYIYGEVQNAGSFPFVIGLTARRAVAIAGGFTPRARHDPVTVVREGQSGVTKLQIRLDHPVFPGDVIEVSRRLF